MESLEQRSPNATGSVRPAQATGSAAGAHTKEPSTAGRTSADAKVRFPGLNSLRFYAALFVVIGHIPLNQESLRLPHAAPTISFYRGAIAVSFFFTLSGFLITYLLLQESRRTGKIDVRSFYLRRICRIWPVYFAVILFGLFFYNALLPLLGIPYRVEYNLWTALLLYIFFLPNLMNSLYTVGGILNPTWSIGVEEQFYLAWAPAVRKAGERLPLLCGAVLAAFFGLSILNHYDVFGPYEWKNFVGQLEFHFMAAGALGAWALFRHRERLLGTWLFSSRFVQVALFALVLDFYFLGYAQYNWFFAEAIQLVLYTWLILNVAGNPRNVLPVENRACDYLGTISYGIYMFHMVAVYATSQVFRVWHGWQGSLPLYYAAYYMMAIGLTLLLAHLSYWLYELPFLRLKDRRGSLAQSGRTEAPLQPAP